LGHNEFKTKFLSYLDQFENLKDKHDKFKFTLNKVIKEELPSRDSSRILCQCDLVNAKRVRLNIKVGNIFYNGVKNDNYFEKAIMKCFPQYAQGWESFLTVSVLIPDWRNGWKSISKDGIVSDWIDDFFYNSTIYIQRSYQLNLIASIALVYGIPCDFRGSRGRWVKLNNFPKKESDIDIIPKGKKGKEVAEFLKTINALDPHVNRTIFYYIKSLELFETGYYEEVVTNLDNLVAIIDHFIKKRFNNTCLDRENGRNQMVKELGLSKKTRDELEQLYLLRNGYASHPADYCWWDFYETFEEDVKKFFLTIKRTLISFYNYEKANRVVESHPDIWSEWFENNAEMLYDVIYHKNLKVFGVYRDKK